ncbi:MAG: HYR domain-containing protein [bacterium]
MVKKVSACFLFIVFLCFSLNAYAQTRTEWEQNNGEGLVEFAVPSPSHGDESEYSNATIPGADDPNWFALTDQENIAYSLISSSLCDDTNDIDFFACLSGGQFTYFRTDVDVPANAEKVEVSVEVAVDGIRITLFNSWYPGGKDIAFVSPCSATVEILLDDIALGEINRIVITHVDDCCCSNSILNDVKILIDGQTVYTCAPPMAVTRDITVMLNESGTANIIPEEVNAGSTHECGLDLMTVEPDFFTCNHIGQNTVILTVTDVKGMSDSKEAVVTVVDNILPSVSGCPADITVDNAPGECKAEVTWTPPTFTDNCQVKSVTTTREPGEFPAECSDSAQGTLVTYTALDTSDNKTECSFTVTVLDKEDPVMITCPADITVNNAPGECGANVTWDEPTYSDNCGIASVTSTPNKSGDFFQAECADSAQGTLITYTAVDNCGNTNTECSFTVTVIDNEPPAIVKDCPDDITVYNDPGLCGAVVTWNPPVFSDNCEVASVESTSKPGDFFPAECADNAQGTIVTYTAKDGCGNTTICSFKVTVLDMEAPVIGVTGVDGNYDGLRLDGIYGYWDANAIVFWNTDDIVVSYDVTDNCDPDPVITYTVEWEGEVQEGVGELDPNAKTITIDPYLLVGDIKVTVTATDYCGNSASDSTEFTIILKVSKTIVKPERFCVNPGKFTVFVWFPDPFDVTTITDAMADAAPLLKMNTCGWCQDRIKYCEEYKCDECEDGCVNDVEEYEDEEDDECDDECKCQICDSCENWNVKAILKFNRYGVPESLVDRYFILRGIFEYNGKMVYFQGSDEVKFECNKGGKSSTRKPPKFQLPQQNPLYSGYHLGNVYNNFNWLYQKSPKWGYFWNLPLFYYEN